IKNNDLIRKSWLPFAMGVLAGFISFASMSSGFIGTYSGILTLAISLASTSIVVPVLGCLIFGVSMVFALATGFLVKHYTIKSIVRQEVMGAVKEQERHISDQFEKTHEVEMVVLNKKITQLSAIKSAPLSLQRSNSWNGSFFNQRPNLQRSSEPDILHDSIKLSAC
ncbi:hypothetical protein N9L02_02075, partial [Gammaproteobacteria bacterium]|nr:hypothetical protein [Gammaproteobacteria bacterium]